MKFVNLYFEYLIIYLCFMSLIFLWKEEFEVSFYLNNI